MSSPDTPPPWAEISRDPEFRRLLRAKVRFIAPATAFFVIYYFALPVLVAFAPDFMNQPVLGPVNLAYLFALSQFFMAWLLAAFYVVVAAGWDRRAAAILRRHQA